MLSFTKAATELNISRVAVSQQMRTLEDFVGLQLFHRLHRALKLTTAGERYHRTVAGALDQILQSTVALKRGAEQSLVTVTASAGFATYWLMPNIRLFQAAHPEVELRFVVTDRYLNLVEENIDVAVRYGTPPFTNVDSEHLVQETIAPTCSEGFLNDGRKLSPKEMLTQRLIHLDGPYDEQVRWSHWFRKQSLVPPTLSSGIAVNTYTNLVQAALDGQGFALIGNPLAGRYLQSGSLIQPVDAEAIPRRSFYAATASGLELSNAASAFKKWLIESFRV